MFENTKNLSLKVLNEYDLHTKVADFIRRFYPEAIFAPGLGELRDTSGKRISSYRKGCQKGQSDIIISSPLESIKSSDPSTSLLCYVLSSSPASIKILLFYYHLRQTI